MITISLKNDRRPEMHQPVDQGRRQSVVHIKEFAPLPEGTIRGNHDRSNFISGGDNLEQHIGPLPVDGQIAQLIEEEKTGTHLTSWEQDTDLDYFVEALQRRDRDRFRP